MELIAKSNPEREISFDIPDFDYFGELLHDRLHAILYHIEEIDSKFMLITNLYDRDANRIANRVADGEEPEALTYNGTDQCRVILEKDSPDYYKERLRKKGEKFDLKKWKAARDLNWEALRNKIMPPNYKNLETFEYFEEFRQGELDLADIKIGELKEYFKELNNPFQENEFPILRDYFDLQTDKYIAIPLLGMGEFQGLVTIVFKAEEVSHFERGKNIRRIIKLFQIEYDNLTLDWDVANINIKKESLMKKVIGAVKTTNPIQELIKLKKYYENSAYYHDQRIDQSDKVVGELKDQYRLNAVTTILLDSYAHNISAHSLTTLTWWFREMAEFLREPAPNVSEEEQAIRKNNLKRLGRGSNPLIQYYDRHASEGLTLAPELAPLFKFLLEKGAFWSGITRQTNFAGKISSAYSVLWYDFINNPLYLGTIAHTEKVKKLHLNITIYEVETDVAGELFKNQKIIKRSEDGRLLDGAFASIDLAQASPPNKSDDTNKRSDFVQEGELYPELSRELQALKLYFPGGVVGKHAFFTLLENEIRNVKHFSGDILERIQEDGLILNVSFHVRPVDSKLFPDGKQLIKIGVWLKHEVDITPELLLGRIEGLEENIITDDTFKPRLGGRHQDKICASMLLMNAFTKVEEDNSPLGIIYHPWIKSATDLTAENTEQIINELEVSNRRYRELKQQGENINEAIQNQVGKGYLKKYFHLWRGEEIVYIDKIPSEKQEVQSVNPLSALENNGRFKMIALTDNVWRKRSFYKEKGTIRIFPTEQSDLRLGEAYRQWLPIWLRKEVGEKLIIDFFERETNVARLSYTTQEVTFLNSAEIENAILDEAYIEDYVDQENKLAITIAHGGHLAAQEKWFNYRSHGELVRYFGGGINPKELTGMPLSLRYELMETLTTKICIFDRRIYNRMVSPEQRDKKLQTSRLDLYRDQLRIDFRGELEQDWDDVKARGFQNYHFLILHLSFIEAMEDAKGKKYSEERILEFINDQILAGAAPESIGDDFILVITTGRGRMVWWDTIQATPAYARFTTFRPIESILGAVEDALEMPDDFDLKHNLCKLLFGS